VLSATPSEAIALAPDLIAAGAGVFLIAGLWTPVMGALAALDEGWIALWLHSLQEHTWIHVFLAVLSVSVAMLGPGAWSIDSRLFGRKRFDIDRTRGTKQYL
jgi:uncharacterized membrane protein YphA (DoxX/SURF4 family)